MPTTLITGANSGIGLATAHGLAARGHDLVLLCRQATAGQAVVDDLRARHGIEASLLIADLADYDSVRLAAEAFLETHERLDVLLLNAGAYQPRHRTNAQGHELTFAVNHLGHFLLTHLLRPRLYAAPHARIISLSSRSHAEGTIDFDDLHKLRKPYSGYAAYSDSKLANLLFVRELARRLEGTHVVAHAVHPGVIRTGFAQDEPGFLHRLYKIAAPFMRSPDAGARTSLHVATSDEARTTNGRYWARSRITTPRAKARNDADARRLWEVSEALVAPVIPWT